MTTKSRFAGRRSRQGLTLLELVVVMAILVAVGGLVVPLLGNYLHRANIASCTTNIPEMDKWVQTYANIHAEYPDMMDNLVIEDELADYVAEGDLEGAASIEAEALTEEEAAALNEAGITTVCDIVEDAGGDWNPTFWPYGASRSTSPGTSPVDETLSVATLTATGMRLMGLPGANAAGTNYKYVIFGMNTPCTLFRNMVEEAPYHFADTPSEDPARFYMAFGAVFMVARPNAAGTASETLEKARYMGTIAFHDFGLSTAGMHTEEWWKRMNEERPDR